MKKSVTVIFLSILPFVVLTITVLTITTEDKDICLDTGICKEGLEVNTINGNITISKENCIKYNWLWNEERRYCNVEPE